MAVLRGNGSGVESDMDVIFQVDVRKKNRKLEERYRRTAFDLYRKGTRRSAGAWVLLIWYSIVLIISLGGGGGAYTLRSFIVEVLLVFIWFLIAFRRFRNRVMLRLLFLTIELKERGDTGTFSGNRFVFGEEGFRAITVGDMMWKYPVVDKVAESRDAVFLYFKEDSGLYFAKSDFTVGDSKAFLQFIAEKTGREVIQLKG